MKNLFFIALTMMSLCVAAQDNTIRDGGEYYIYNMYYNRLLGANDTYNGMQLSDHSKRNPDNYVWVAEASNLDAGYYWLHLKGTTKYLQASNAEGNTWSVWMAGSLNKAYNSYEWMLTPGINGSIKSKRGEIVNGSTKCYLGVDPDHRSEEFISVYYDKTLTDKSVWQIVDASFPLDTSRLKLYTDELDNVISRGESVYENPIYGQKSEKDELAIALYNARSARENASLADADLMTQAIDALKAATENAMDGHYTIWISGSSFGTNTAFTVAFKGVEFVDSLKNCEVTALIRNTKGTGLHFFMGDGYVRLGDTKIEAPVVEGKPTCDWQLAFDGTNVSVYGNGQLAGTLPQTDIPAVTSVARGAEWTMFGLEALKSCTPEIVSYNFAFAPGEFYQENGKSKSTALKIIGTDIVLDEPIDYHILADAQTISEGSSLELNDPDAWVIFDNVRPSDVISKYLKYVKVDGKAAANGTNCRVAIYLQGAVVYPWSSNDVALYGYSGQQFSGEEYKLKLGKNDNMGEADNNTQSFILKRGYMVCFSTKSDGSGYSRVYVADHEDKKIEALPAELNLRISRAYIRKWNWVSKKGWCSTEGTGAINTEGKLVGSTWFYTWGADRSTQTDMEYIPTKQHIYWPSYSAMDQANSTACLGLNEPDHSEQHNNCDCKGVIDSWKATTMMPDFLGNGLRIGSPAPTDANWLYSFMGHVDDMAYRCDFVAFHCYWGTNEAANSDAWWSRLNEIYKKTKRPIWITEWNNGASWTNESWPSSYSDRLTYQMNKVKEILSTLDNADFVERYAFYNWDYGMPRMAMSWDSNKNNWWVTPCGEVYRDTHPGHAYKEKMQYVPHYWWPKIKTEGSAITKVTLKTAGRTMDLRSFNANGDLTASEVLEYKDPETGEWRELMENPYTRSSLDLSERSTIIKLDSCPIAMVLADSITLRLKMTMYNKTEVRTEPFAVKNMVNIKNYYKNIVGLPMIADESGVGIKVETGGIAVTSDKAVGVKVCTIGGAVVADEVVEGHDFIGLPAGIYVVNGVKVNVK